MGPSRRQWPEIFRRIDVWAQALICATREHGQPNSFGTGELAGEYGLKQRHGYYVGMFRLDKLRARLRELGWKGSAPTYANGRFYV